MGDDKENPFILPEDPVTPEHREKLGMHRLRRWWEARVIGLANWEAGKKLAKTKERKFPESRKMGGGWVEITFPDGESIKVHGEKARKEALDNWVITEAEKKAVEEFETAGSK
jgi:hypothetical protein